MSVRTLLVMPNWVGDCVMALPVVEALAAADRQVVTLAKRHLTSLLALSPAVSETVERGANDAETIARLREARCDEAVVLPNSIRSAWLPYQAGIPWRWGYRGGWRAPLLRPPVPRPRDLRGRGAASADRGLPRAARRARRSSRPRRGCRGCRAIPPCSPSAPSGCSARGSAAAAPLVGLFAGAEWGPSKRWPWRRFADLATAAAPRKSPASASSSSPARRRCGRRCASTRRAARSTRSSAPTSICAASPRLLAHLDVLVTNDSGPMHLAAAFGVRCVALFGPTDPRRTAPAGDGHRVLYTDRWCSPCFRRHCPLLHHRCLRDIGVDAVAAAAVAVLTPAS